MAPQPEYRGLGPPRARVRRGRPLREVRRRRPHGQLLAGGQDRLQRALQRGHGRSQGGKSIVSLQLQ